MNRKKKEKKSGQHRRGHLSQERRIIVKGHVSESRSAKCFPVSSRLDS